MTSSRIGSPLRVTNKNFQFQTRDNSLNNPKNVVDPSVLGHIRSASTGNGINPNIQHNKAIEQIRRKSNTARDGKIANESSKTNLVNTKRSDNIKDK